MQVEQLAIGQWKTNCFIVSDSNNEAVIIDPGNDSSIISDLIKEKQLIPKAIINTHSHHDHIGAVDALKKEFNIPFYLNHKEDGILKRAKLYSFVFEGHNKIDIPEVDHDLSDMDFLQFGDLKIQVLHTPGHTPGGTCFLINNCLFTGDTLLYNVFATKELPGADNNLLKETVDSLFKYPPETMIHPGHGRITGFDQTFRDKVKKFL